MWQHGLPTVGGFFHLEGCTVASPVPSGGCSVYSYPAPFGVLLGLPPSLVAASSFLPLRGDRLLLRAMLFYLWLASPPVGSVGEVTAAGFSLGCVVRGSPRVARPLGLRGSIASKLRAPRIVVRRPSDGADEDDNPSGSSISSTSSRLNRSRWFSAMSVKNTFSFGRLRLPRRDLRRP